MRITYRHPKVINLDVNVAFEIIWKRHYVNIYHIHILLMAIIMTAFSVDSVKKKKQREGTEKIGREAKDRAELKT